MSKIDFKPIRKIMIKQEKSVYKWFKKYNWRQATLWEWENKRRRPKINTMKRFAKHLYGSEDNWILIAKFF